MADKKPSRAPRLALVTGASSGIGAAFAERLAGDGYDLILVARRRDRLEELAARVRAEDGVQAEVLAADLARHPDLARVEARIGETGGLDMLVNDAGFGVYRPLADLDPTVIEEMILVNVLALARLTRAALPGMLSRGRGDIINLASGLAFMPGPTMATYTGSKAFVINFTRAIDQEVRGKGIRLQALCPGVVPTEFQQRSGTDLSRIPRHAFMSAEDTVRASLAGLDLGEVVCMPGLSDLVYMARYEDAQADLTRHPLPGGGIASRYREPGSGGSPQ